MGMKTPSVMEGFLRYDLPLLVSYPRSGTNWIRYIIEYISGQPTPGQPRLHTGGNFIIDRAHKAYPILHQHPKAILVIRDYRECLLRSLPDLWEQIPVPAKFLQVEWGKTPPVWYALNIEAFDRFRGDKLLLYYEDLIQDSASQVWEISEFLGLDTAKTEDFVADLETRCQESIRAYTSGGHTAFTAKNPKNFSYHANKHLTPALSAEFDAFFSSQYPHLFEKYLKRYTTCRSQL